MKKIQILLFFLLTSVTGCSTIDFFGGNFEGEPAEMMDHISPEAKALITKAFEFETGDTCEIIDYHTHIFGSGYDVSAFCDEIGNSGVYFNARLFSWSNPLDRMKTAVFLSAMKITNPKKADEQYARRFLELVKGFPPHANIKFCIYALDAYHNETGEINWERTDLYIPNDYVVKLADCLNEKMGKEYFIPVISLHPLREDALQLLEYYHDLGIRYVKWLPSVMNIDPASHTSSPFLKKMAELDMILLSHTGDEETFTVYNDHQKFGNPMRLRQALESGVTVVMLHSGQLTKEKDPEYPHYSQDTKDQNYLLFKDMMGEKRYQQKVFGEISALVFPRYQHILFDISADASLHGRMINGSDYPVPAVHMLNPTKALYYKGAITRAEKLALDEIYSYNPMLFDFVVKRTFRHPDTNKRLPESMFLSIECLKKNYDKAVLSNNNE